MIRKDDCRAEVATPVSITSGISPPEQADYAGVEIRVNQLAERQRSMVKESRLQKRMRLQTTRYGTPITRFVLKNTNGT